MRRLLFGAFLAACTPPAEDASQVEVIEPTSLALPHSATGEAAIDDLPLVILTKTKLVLSGRPRASLALPLGFESMSGPIIEPLRAWIRDAHFQGHDMAVAIDSDATSELAMQVLATCMDAGFTSFHVATTQGGATAQIPLSFGRPDRPDAKPLTASVFQGGVILKVAEGSIAPGCEALGDGVAVSRVAGVIDRDKLASCVARAHKAHQTNVAAVIVTKSTVFSDVVTLLDAMRHDAETDSITLGISP